MRRTICILFRLWNRDQTNLVDYEVHFNDESIREQSPALHFTLTYFVDHPDHVVDDVFSFHELQLALLFVGCADQRETRAGTQKSSSAMKSQRGDESKPAGARETHLRNEIILNDEA
ncbi:hypothetical protein NL676_029451 [Syzygium grande]|nr:hypothetical protein NL676_029451 [Syzygium grande]